MSSSSSSRRIVRLRGRPYIGLADPPNASKSSSSKNAHREEARRKANVNANDSRGWRDDAAFRHTSDDVDVEVVGEEEGCAEEDLDL